MRNLLFFLLLTGCLLCPRTAHAVQVLTDSVPSRILNTKCAYNVMLPDSYEKNPQKKYPVLYLLHGLGGDNENWNRNTQISIILNRMIQNGEACEMIIVTPKAGGNVGAGVWNGYFNMPGWNYEDFFFTEFIPYIEQKYRIMGDRRHRAIGGLSMGGGGSTSYAQRHPDMFCAVYAMSALMHLDEGAGLPPRDNEKMKHLNRSVYEHSTVRFVNEASEEVRQQLRSIEWMVDCGDDDFLFDCNIAFHQAMRKAHIPCQLRVRDGSHNWEYWNTALYTALPFFSRIFNK